jgi:RNA recognition motif-containing protein
LVALVVCWLSQKSGWGRREEEMEVENSIYVGGLAYDSKEEVVKKAFVEYGDVVSVKIVR